jgi:hypothetical protein
MRLLAGVMALLCTGAVQAQETGQLVRFITCPIYRDTDFGRKSGCWLADDLASGIRYDVTQSPYQPDWGHEVLVEGRVSDESPDLCGSPVLNPVRTSILEGECPRHMLPAEGYPGRKYELPPRNIAPLAVARPVPPGPYGQRRFNFYFEFDRDFLVYQYDDYLIDQAVTWIRAAKPKKLVVTGYAATTPEEVSGRMIAESPEIARTRAEAVSITFKRLFPTIDVETHWKLDAQVTEEPDADGIPGQSQRRVEMEALF